MGVTKLLLLLLLVLFGFIFQVSFSQLHKHTEKPPIHEPDVSVRNVVVRKRAGAGATGGGGGNSGRSVGGGGSGGRSVGGGGNNGYRGPSNYPPKVGGGAVIPVYTAGSGAATNHNNNHNAASICRKCQKDRITFVATVLTLFLLHFSM